MPQNKFTSNWSKVLSNSLLRREFLITFVLLVVTVYLFSRYLIYNESRTGAIIDDPLLRHFDAINLNPLIFFVIYSSLVLGLIAFSFSPIQLMIAFQTYIVMVIFRMITMYLVPLDPPAGCIDLEDPVVFGLGTGQKVVKDLFFSGHTATAFMLFQVARNKYLKIYFLLATIIVGVCVILQKAHYTIDVFVGIIFSYTSYNLILSLKNNHISKDYIYYDKKN